MTEGRSQKSEDRGQTPFAERVRRAARGLGQFRAGDLADAVEVRTYAERQAVTGRVRDFVKQGEFVRIERGLYKYVVRTAQPTKRQRLWDVVRRLSVSSFNLDDLEQLTGIGRGYIKEFCVFLVREGYARRVRPGRFLRAKVMEIAVPPDTKKNEKLRALRKGRKGETGKGRKGEPGKDRNGEPGKR